MGQFERAWARSLIIVTVVVMFTMVLPRQAAAAQTSEVATAKLVARLVRTVDSSDLSITRPTGIVYDAAQEEFVVTGSRASGHVVVRITSRWDLISTVDSAGPDGDRGTLTATNPEDGLDYTLDSSRDTLTATDGDGNVVAVYDTSSISLSTAESMTFALSTDVTDDPGAHNLYVADSGDGTWNGGITELTLEQPVALAANESAVLVQKIDTSVWDPPSTDPSAIQWDPNRNEFIVADSEVNETNLFDNVNMWVVDQNGGVLDTRATDGPLSAGFSDEPTGLGYDAATNTLFVTDDTGTRAVYVVKSGPDGLFGTADDMATEIEVPASDPEDPEFLNGILYFLSGVDREIYTLDSVDGIFGNGNDQLDSFDISHLGPTDFEGLTSAPVRGTLYVGAVSDKFIFEITTSGTLIRTIEYNISGLGKASGLAMAPSSFDPSTPTLWVVDRGADEINDGDMWEIWVSNLDDVDGNTAPTANDDAATTNEETAVVIEVLVNDTDVDGDTLTVINVSDPAGGSVVNDGNTVTYTPDPNFNGSDTFTYQAFDGLVPSNTATVTITVAPVTDPPVANDDSATTTEDTSVTIDVAANDTDPDGNLDPASANTTCLTCSEPANGTLVNNGDGTFTYTPDAGFTGTDSFVYKICDGDSTCDTATVTITVSPPAVIVDAVASGTTNGSSLIISHTASGSNRLMLVGVSINNDNFETVSSVTYNGIPLTQVGSVDHQGSGGDDSRVEIWNLVDPPLGTYDVVITFSADLTRYAVAGVTTFSGVDQIDPLGAFAGSYGDSSSPSLSVPSASDELVFGVFACEACTSVSFSSPGVEQWNFVAGGGNTIGAGESAPGASPEMTISASLGTSDHWAMGGISIKSSGTSTPANHPAVAIDDTVSTTEDTSVTIDVAANDTDPDGNLDPASANTACATCSEPANGTLVNNGDGTFTYTPDPDFNGTNSFAYEICDTERLCDTATVTITVSGTNDPPVAVDDNFMSTLVPHGGTITNLNVLANDTDADGTLDVASVTITGATNGTATANADGTVNFTHDGSETTTASFTYTVDDDNGATSNVATVSLAVTGVVHVLTPAGSDGYSTLGGPNSNKHLEVTVSLMDGTGAPVAGITVSATITGPNVWHETGTTDALGEVIFKITNAPSGTYTTTVTDVTASGLTWDGMTPPNSFSK